MNDTWLADIHAGGLAQPLSQPVPLITPINPSRQISANKLPKQLTLMCTPDQRQKLTQPLWIVDNGALTTGIKTVDMNKIETRIYFRAESEILSQLHYGNWIRPLSLCNGSVVIGTEYKTYTEFATDKCILGPRQLITRELLIKLGCDVEFKDVLIKTHLYMFSNPTKADIITCLKHNPETSLQIQMTDELWKIALTATVKAFDYIQNPSTEISMFAVNLYPQLASYIPEAYVLQIIEKDLSKLKNLKCSYKTIRMIYEIYGPFAMRYIDDLPEQLQLEMINSNPKNICYIQNPSKQVINTILITEFAYCPNYSFRSYFEQSKPELNYDEFCHQIKQNNALVYSNMIFYHLIGAPNSQHQLNIVLNDSTNFVKYLNSTKYISSKNNTCWYRKLIHFDQLKICIWETAYDPLYVIMNTNELRSHRLAFDGVGLYTYEKLLGQPIENIIESCAFEQINLLRKCHIKSIDDVLAYFTRCLEWLLDDIYPNYKEYKKCYQETINCLKGRKSGYPELTTRPALNYYEN